jgi:hypothetical protein
MTINEAAQELQAMLRGKHAGLVAIGIGEDAGQPNIIVYTRQKNSKGLEMLKAGWRGFSVKIRKTARPRLLSTVFAA